VQAHQWAVKAFFETEQGGGLTVWSLSRDEQLLLDRKKKLHMAVGYAEWESRQRADGKGGKSGRPDGKRNVSPPPALGDRADEEAEAEVSKGGAPDDREGELPKAEAEAELNKSQRDEVYQATCTVAGSVPR
jgi:hypothetical protein